MRSLCLTAINEPVVRTQAQATLTTSAQVKRYLSKINEKHLKLLGEKIDSLEDIHLLISKIASGLIVFSSLPSAARREFGSSLLIAAAVS